MKRDDVTPTHDDVISPDDPTPLVEQFPGAATDRALDRGAQLGRYVVEALLGAGGMGEVYRARDPRLERDVAIKVLRGRLAPGVRAQARLAREAQAMARLAHPNVVAIYDVGTVGTYLYLAMELVVGRTLRARHANGPRAWRPIVADYLQAARGLAAAHGAGLVHRDFKPDNVLVGDDGRVRVVDFGIALVDPDEARGTPSGGLQTSASTLLGTPGYMAPEALASARIDARADQYSFFAALHQTLYGAVPTTPFALPHAPRIPRALAAAITRGLAPRRDDRFATMDDVVRALDAILKRRARTLRVAGVATIAVAAAGATWGLTRADEVVVDPCAGVDARLANVWDDARRATFVRHLETIDPRHGRERATAATAVFDRRAADWRGMHVEACRAARVVGNQDDRTLELRMRCLDRRRDELDTNVGLVLATTATPALDRTLVGALQLEPLATCADPEALARAMTLPTEPARRARALAIEAELAPIARARRSGQIDGLRARIAPVVARARELGHPQTLASALAELAAIENDLGETAAEVATYRELAEVAARAHDDARETTAWATLVSLLGFELGKPDEGRALIPVARASLARAGDPPALHVTVLKTEAAFDAEHGEPARARELLADIIRVLEREGAGTPGATTTARLGDVWLDLGDVEHHTGHFDAAVAAYRRAIELWQRAYGPDHADVAWGYHDLAIVLSTAKRFDEAIAAGARAIEIREARLGDSPLLALSLTSQAEILVGQLRAAEALPYAERALALYAKLEGPDSIRGADAMMTRATIATYLGHLDEARAGYARAIAVFERAGAKTENLGIAHRYLAMLAARTDCERARPEFARSLAIVTELDGPTGRNVAFTQISLAACDLRGHHPEAAIPRLEQALAVEGAHPNLPPFARLLLGRALVESGRDRARGLALARAALPEVSRTDADLALYLPETEAWLRTQR